MKVINVGMDELSCMESKEVKGSDSGSVIGTVEESGVFLGVDRDDRADGERSRGSLVP